VGEGYEGLASVSELSRRWMRGAHREVRSAQALVMTGQNPRSIKSASGQELTRVCTHIGY
jgi:hypothetical protein